MLVAENAQVLLFWTHRGRPAYHFAPALHSTELDEDSSTVSPCLVPFVSACVGSYTFSSLYAEEPQHGALQYM